MEKLNFKIESFEGPLDLLLFLISKNKLNICDIKISELLEQYLEHIETMKIYDMEISSEFLEMAARLIHIKTLYLLPKPNEAEELVKELSGELIEYQKVKLAAEKFGQVISFDSFVRYGEEIEPDRTYKGFIPLKSLFDAYMCVNGRAKNKLPPKEEEFSRVVPREKYVSVTSRIISILRKLKKNIKIKYYNLFKDNKDRSGMIATFLALLELIHGNRVNVSEDNDEIILKDGAV